MEIFTGLFTYYALWQT